MCKSGHGQTTQEAITRLTDVELNKLLEKQLELISLHKKKPDTCASINWGKYDLSGVNFDKHDLRYANFKNANLQDASFQNAKLRHADFTGAILDDVAFDNSDLAFCEFNGAKMRATSFRQATLFRSEFRELQHDDNIENLSTDLRYADFTEADMREARIEDARHIIISQFAGANLKGAILPQNLIWSEYLSSVRLAAKEARKLFTPLMLLSIYLLWAVFEITPSNFKIPLIQIEIKPSNMLVIGSILLSIISSYYRYYLDRLWDMISKLPDVFPSGPTIIKHPDPWFIIEYSKLFLYHFRNNRTSMDFFYGLSACSLSYFVPLIALSASWFKFLQISKSLTGVSFIIFSTIFCLIDTIIRITNSYRSLYRFDPSLIISTPYGIWVAIYFISWIVILHSYYIISI